MALYALRVKAGPFGNNAPAWDSLPATLKDGPYKEKDWDTRANADGTPNPGTICPRRTIQPARSSSTASTTPPRVRRMAPGWAVLLTDNNVQQILHVIDARPVSKAAYALSARVTRLTFR